MQDLLIVGAGVHAAETAEIVGRINRVLPTWNLLGYLAAQRSGRRRARDERLPHPRLLGEARDYPGAMFATPFDAMEVKDIPAERLATIIDPSAWVSASATIGPGCVLYPSCFVGLHAVLGERVFALSSAVINHDDHLGDRVTVCSNVSIAGNVQVEADCYLGQACTVKQFVRVGKGSLIGMGAVVLRDVPPNSVMVGNPRRQDQRSACRRPDRRFLSKPGGAPFLAQGEGPMRSIGTNLGMSEYLAKPRRHAQRLRDQGAPCGA